MFQLHLHDIFREFRFCPSKTRVIASSDESSSSSWNCVLCLPSCKHFHIFGSCMIEPYQRSWRNTDVHFMKTKRKSLAKYSGSLNHSGRTSTKGLLRLRMLLISDSGAAPYRVVAATPTGVQAIQTHGGWVTATSANVRTFDTNCRKTVGNTY